METEVRKLEGASFEYFPKLPLEIRRQIWNTALKFPEILQLALNRTPCIGCSCEHDLHYMPRTPTSRIAICCVNREAGAEAKKLLQMESPYGSHISCWGWASNIDTIWLADFSESWHGSTHADYEISIGELGIQKMAISISYLLQGLEPLKQKVEMLAEFGLI